MHPRAFRALEQVQAHRVCDHSKSGNGDHGFELRHLFNVCKASDYFCESDHSEQVHRAFPLRGAPVQPVDGLNRARIYERASMPNSKALSAL
jgi:hypothetical protein